MSIAIVTGLTFGDEGKGTTVDYLTRETEAKAIVRFNGGPQAAHNVVDAEHGHHTFHQFGSGSFAPSAPSTFLSRFCLVSPLHAVTEARELAPKLGVGCDTLLRTLCVDERALLLTPYHAGVNQAQETARGMARHGSCGFGVGVARQYECDHPDGVIRMADCANRTVMREKLERQRHNLYQQYRTQIRAHPDICDMFSSDALISDVCVMFERFATMVAVGGPNTLRTLCDMGNVVFEGAQGVLLDETFGFHPHTTWTNTTNVNAFQLLNEIHYNNDITTYGVVRTYLTRHGAGPFPSQSKDKRPWCHEPHNPTNPWQQSFRHGYFDRLLVEYALRVLGGVDQFVLTHTDRTPDRYCDGYDDTDAKIRWSSIPEHLDPSAIGQWLANVVPVIVDHAVTSNLLESLFHIPVGITSGGPRATDKRRRES